MQKRWLTMNKIRLNTCSKSDWILHHLSNHKYRWLKKVIHQINSKNEWFLLSTSFTTKFELIFVLALANSSSWKFHFKSNSRSFEQSVWFYVTTSGNIERFQCFNFETNFLKNKHLFQKIGVSFIYLFSWKWLRLKTHHFRTKLSCQC